MKAVILFPCLMATVFASPIRKVRDASTSQENLAGNAFQFMNHRFYQTGQTYPGFNLNRFPGRFGYTPNYQYPTSHGYGPYPGYTNYNGQDPFQQNPNNNDYIPGKQYPNYNPFLQNPNNPTLFNSYPWTMSRINVLGANGAQVGVLSTSAEVSTEDTNNMEGTLVTMPFMNMPFGVPDYGLVLNNGVPAVPGGWVPFRPDNERPFTPGLDTNSAGVGFDQQNSQDPATEVFDTEEPTSVLPYSDYEQGMDSLGLNGVDDSMIGGSNEGLGQQNTIFNPFGLDVIFDQSWNNEEFSDQQTPNENLDEDDLTQEDETQNIGANTMDMNSMAFSQEEGNNDDGTESNLNVAVLNNNGPYTQEQDNAQSIEDDLNQMNVAGTNQQIDTQSTEDNLNQMNVAGTNQQIDTQSTEGDLNQINVAGSNVNNGSHFNQDENGAGVNVYDSSKTDNIQTELNSCKMVHCRHGRVCKLNEIGYPTCICQEPTSCPVSSPELQQVCGTNNRTYGNSCQFFASKCLLDGTKRGHNIHLDYIGPCKYIAPCLESELNEFPLRLRGWLKNILVEMYERDLYSPGLLSPKERTTVKKIYDHEHHLHPRDYSLDQLFNDFSQNYQMYIYPVHWQFSQLDRHPMDGYLSHTELAPLRTPLIPLEHCTSQFFGGCDLDGDKDISLREWSRCFGLKEEDINPNLVF
ncbi:SPARC-like protein 1 [Scyliorhinus canicula]|uniref:SPARC-like protein 1 n=1 Tax=Scyliorhinus canicula TaxID=7830 RepID=UPI0018F56C65|nr:SPARC-like protein 1 [Scyliorhinus canicula]XP_038648790.1 SPARC-like protein 1 [Scyliorhinus canicula]